MPVLPTALQDSASTYLPRRASQSRFLMVRGLRYHVRIWEPDPAAIATTNVGCAIHLAERLALRGINALCSGACAMPAQPVISAPAEMPDAMMKVRLVSLMPCSWWEFGFVAFAMG